MESQSREQWEQELRDRQTHNYVFPGTVINSTAAIRKLIDRPLRGPLQKIGFVLWVAPILLLLIPIGLVYEAAKTPDFSWTESAANLAMGLGVLLCVLAVAGVVIGIAYSVQRVMDFHVQQPATRVRERLHISTGRRKRRR